MQTDDPVPAGDVIFSGNSLNRGVVAAVSERLKQSEAGVLQPAGGLTAAALRRACGVSKHAAHVACVTAALAWGGLVSTAHAQAEHSTVILLMDASGSMASSDPGCVRADAAELLLSLTPDGDRISLASFGTSVVPLTNGVEVVNQDSRRRAIVALKRCEARDQYTDFGAALNRELPQGVRASFPVQVVLFTDGKHDPPAGSPTDAVINQGLIELKALGAMVHTLGLGAGADRTLLSRLSESTGGRSVYSANSSDLLSGFLSVARILGRRWLLVDSQVSTTTDVQIPAWVKESRAVFMPAEIGTSANGDGVASVLTARLYQVFSTTSGRRAIRISPSGAGRLQIDGAGSVALVARHPKAVPVGAFFDCGAKLVPTEGGGLGAPAFMMSAVVSARLGATVTPLYDDGRHGDGTASDGDWGGKCRAESAGPTSLSFELITPSLSPPTTEERLEVLERPIQVEEPGLAAGLLAATLGRPLVLSLRNLSDLPMAGELSLGGTTVPWRLEARQVASTSTHLTYPLSSINRVSVSFTDPETRHEFPLGSVRLYPSLWLPAAFGLVAVALGLSSVFPARSAAGSMLSIRGASLADGEPFAAAGVIEGGGVAKFRDPLPEPFGHPGQFHAKSGLWRSGLTYTPESWVLAPQFSPRAKGSSTSGFHCITLTTWTVTHGGYRVTYTLTPRRR